MRLKSALNPHARRILLGAGAGLTTALLCPHLPDGLQMPCRVVIALLHAWWST